jgi:hypothetical protein
VVVEFVLLLGGPFDRGHFIAQSIEVRVYPSARQAALLAPNLIGVALFNGPKLNALVKLGVPCMTSYRFSTILSIKKQFINI